MSLIRAVSGNGGISIEIGAAGSNRIVVALMTQVRTPPVIDTATFNGVSMTVSPYNNPSSGNAASVAYILESSLPASAGTYAIDTGSSSSRVTLLYAENMAQTAPSDTKVDTDVFGTTNKETDLTLAGAGALCVFACISGSTPTGVIGGNTAGIEDTTYRTGYTETQTNVGIVTTSTPAAWAAASFDVSGAASLAIDSTSGAMTRNGTFSVTFSNPAVTPTTSNTTLTNGGDSLTCTSVTGTGPYTATFSVGDLSKQVDATGYDWTLTVDAETDTTGNIPLLIQTGWTKVDLVSPITTDGSLLYGYTGDTPVTGDDLEYIVTSALDSGVTLDVAATAEWTVNETTPGDWVTDITVNRRVVQADGTIGDSAVITLSASGTTDKLVRNVVKSTLSNITLGVMR